MKKQVDTISFVVGLILGIAVIVFAQWCIRFYKSGIDSEDIESPEYNFNMILTMLDENYLWDYDVDELYKGAYIGMVDALGDKYTKCIPYEGEKQKEVEDTMYIYIGAYIILDENKSFPVIERVEQGENADKSGMMSGDVIKEVNGVPTKGLKIEEIVDLFKGNVDQDVEMLVDRDGNEIRMHTKLQKKVIKTVSQKLLKGGIGYVKIDKFVGDTPTYFEDAYKSLSRDKIKMLIVDLRGNSGGETTAAVSVADMFLNKDDLVYSTQNKRGETKEYYASNDKLIEIPTVVLIDGGSASASEILALGLKDHKCAVLVGEKSFGKGISQSVILATKAFRLNVTSAYNFSPNGTCIHGIGIMPDVEAKDDPETEEDEAIEKAVSILTNYEQYVNISS